MICSVDVSGPPVSGTRGALTGGGVDHRTTGSTVYQAQNDGVAAAQASSGHANAPRAAGADALAKFGSGPAVSAHELAKEDHIQMWSVLGREPKTWETTAGLPRHPTRAYANREPPVDTSSWAGRAAAATATSTPAATGAATADPTAAASAPSGVHSAVCFGCDGPTLYQTDTMGLYAQAPGDRKLRAPYVPVPRKRYT